MNTEPDNKIKAVFFDIGETLLTFGKLKTSDVFKQSAKDSYEFLRSLGQPVGNFTRYKWKNLICLKAKYVVSNIKKRDFDAIDLLKKVNRRVELTTQQWQQLAWVWYEPLGKLAKIEADIAQTLDRLKNEMDLKLGIISNTFLSKSILENHLKQAKILDFFSFRFFSYQFNFRKPDIRIFTAAAKKAGIEPENILYVGDRIDNDIDPALKLGMKAVLKNAYTNKRAHVPLGIKRINTLSELPALITAQKI